MVKFNKISKNIKEILIDNETSPGEKIKWLDVTNAGKKEMEYLRKEFDFKLSHLQSSSAKIISQRTIIDNTEDYLFLIIHFPIFQEEIIMPGEIDFFISKNYIVTIHNSNVNGINEFFNLCKKDGDSFLSHQLKSIPLLLYEILEKIMLESYNLLDQNSASMISLEKIIFDEKSKKLVSTLLKLQRNIINTRKIMLNHKNIIKKLISSEIGLLSHSDEEIKKYYLKLIDHSKRFWEILEIQKEMIEVLNNTNESLINYRTNDIMRTLTIFSVIVFPLTLLAGIFGMNTTKGMPFIESSYGFWIILSLMLVSSTGMIIYFHRKKWF